MSEHCISVPIVYDWITKEEDIKKCKYIPSKSNVKQIEDCICINFLVDCQTDTPTTIWQAVGETINAASFSIEHKGGCSCDWLLLANDEELSSVSRNNTFSATVGELERLSVICANDCSDEIHCEGTLYIVVHYQICTNEKSEKNITCFLSDKHGNPIDSSAGNAFICKEVSKDTGRISEWFLSPNGDKIFLQKVTILIEGYYSVKIADLCDNSFVLCTFPISILKSFFLCAPDGTRVECDVANFNCNACIKDGKNYKHCLKVMVEMDFCLNVRSIYRSVIAIKGKLCEPRTFINEKLYNGH